ncbi:hypothetical protein [Streptomyces agglomeratus]|uniref:hypothetical protein n=1 Tax=Streptomyces agglomeratus TaxID=285458 RepID=UPI000854317A|nr:hypothetical protein [Streptomyces agglomeratus]OEJ49665.1 hypothetical protein BGK72_01450 [Streptomyces agglomeratus]
MAGVAGGPKGPEETRGGQQAEGGTGARAAGSSPPAPGAARRGARRHKAEAREKFRERRAREFALAQEREAQRQAARRELEQRAHATAEAWWTLLSRTQAKELFKAVFYAAWKHEGLRVRIPEGGGVAANFAYGVPVHASNRLYGVVRPCPERIPLSPQLA